jgi:hypothetical protein
MCDIIPVHSWVHLLIIISSIYVYLTIYKRISLYLFVITNISDIYIHVHHQMDVVDLCVLYYGVFECICMYVVLICISIHLWSCTHIPVHPHTPTHTLTSMYNSHHTENRVSLLTTTACTCIYLYQHVNHFYPIHLNHLNMYTSTYTHIRTHTCTYVRHQHDSLLIITSHLYQRCQHLCVRVYTVLLS